MHRKITVRYARGSVVVKALRYKTGKSAGSRPDEANDF
jgi:hypothetical protein